MGIVDEHADVVWRAISMKRGEEKDTVVAPSQSPRELGQRHDLERRHTEVGQAL